MALKGTIAKKEITDKILAAFEGSFLYNDGKEIRIPFVEEGNDDENKGCHCVRHDLQNLFFCKANTFNVVGQDVKQAKDK